jgi:hypothetical protein
MPNKRLGLPPRIFFYTVDQIGTLLSLDEEYIKKHLLHFQGRSPGICPRGIMLAINVAPEGVKPEWRVSEQSFAGYLRYKGIRFYERGYVG